jgi:hypothetical protein
MHTAEPLVPEPSCFEDEIPTEKLKRCKSPDINQIAVMIQAGYTNLLNLFRIRKNCQSSRRNLLMYLFFKEHDKTDCSN